MLQHLGRRRRTSRSRFGASAIVAVAALALVACGDDDSGDDALSATRADGGSLTSQPDRPDGASATAGGILRAAAVADPSSLDPQVGPGGNDHVMLYPIFDTLIRFDPATMEPQPGLASAWSFDDPKTLRLSLHDGITFHDGTSLDAEAVKASLERFQGVGAHADLANVTSVEVTGPLEVTLHLGIPDSSMLLVLADRAGMVVSPTAAADADAFAQHPVGAGPFEFVEFRPGDRITYERYTDYWGDEQPTLDGIEMRIIPDRKAAANALLAGQVDFAYGLDAADYSSLDASPELTIGGDITLAFDMVYFNLAQPPLDDARVRNAINMAIDREELVAGALDGRGEPAWLPVPPSHWAFDAAAAPTWPHDPERARQLLAEAGYDDGATVSLLVSTQGSIPTTEAEILKAQLAEVGVTLDITTMDINSAIQQYFEAQSYNSFLAGWSGRPDVGLTYSRLFTKDTYQNPGKVEIAGLEAVLADAVSTEELDARAAQYATANELITEAAPYMPLVYRQGITAYSNRVVGYQPSLLGKPNVSFLGLS
jgi:ABC-type transport system substrate-binding protein